ncbi:MAG TPA: SDR family NAD(P)-dependent oxidoreductase [Steroidobacteraceae bacterium]|nr:SDR family NAD(P)-dependent oxidoreductase [Steroidobacteraceae bacterium]
MEPFRFDGRVAVVTGAGGNPGLGRSYALLLASRGAKVLVNDYGVGPDGRGAIGGGPDDVVREITRSGGEALANRDSVASREGAESIIRTAVDAWGHVDILINNAGIAPFALFQEISDNDIVRVVDVHLMGTIWMCRAAWKIMSRRQYGRIVNVTSSVGLAGVTHQAVYTGAKLGIFGFTRALAAEGRSLGIKVNAVLPMANTLAWETMLAPAFSAQTKQQGLVPDAVAPVAAWLAHERCRVSGAVLGAGGGSIYEVFISKTADTQPDAQLTIEKVDSRFAEAADRSNASEYVLPAEDTGLPFTPKPYDTKPRGGS